MLTVGTKLELGQGVIVWSSVQGQMPNHPPNWGLTQCRDNHMAREGDPTLHRDTPLL